MKTAIYIEDGVLQCVLTPDTDFEKHVLFSFHEQPFTAKIFTGAFYDCRGGWTRQRPYLPSTPNNPYSEVGSLILRVDTKPTAVEEVSDDPR